MIAFKLKPTASQQSKLIWLSSCWMEKRSGNSFTCHWVQMRAWVVDLMVNWWLQMIQLFFKSSSANNNKCRVLRPPTSISVDLCWINFRLNRTFSPFAIVCTLKYCTRFVNLGTERPVESETCGQSYKQFTLVNYDSRVVVTSKLLIFTTLES